MSGITRDEWLRALSDAGLDNMIDDREAISRKEFAAMMDLDIQAAAYRLKALVRAGRASATRKREVCSNGRHQFVVAYRLIEPKKKRR